jgi:hypothetical protein
VPDQHHISLPGIPRIYGFFALLVALLIALAFVAFRMDAENRAGSWLIMLGLMTSFIVVTGRAVTGNWRGVLIDARNRMSLSRLQLFAWTVLILSALLAGIMGNARIGAPSPLSIAVPVELWIVMGISTASLITAPAMLGIKRDRRPDPSDVDRSRRELGRQGLQHVADKLREDCMVAHYDDADSARWSDLFKGDEWGNIATVDFAKMQMFFFTFVLVLGYGTAIAAMFRRDGFVQSLPPVDEGMYVLLGISNTGFLAGKAIPHTKESDG